MIALLVDNNSSDGSVRCVSNRFGGRVRIVALRENRGSSGAFHLGSRIALTYSPRYLLLLDSDVILRPGAIHALRSHLESNSTVGAVGPKIFDFESPHRIQEMGGFVDFDSADLIRHGKGFEETESDRITESVAVDYVPSCCLMVRSSVPARAGVIDPGFFLYWDDVDWMSRIRREGFGVAAVGGAEVSHYGGSGHKGSLLPMYYGWRNRVIFFMRHTPACLFDSVSRTLLIDAARAAYTCRLFSRTRAADMIEHAVTDGFRERLGIKEFERGRLILDRARVFVTQASVESRGLVRAVGHVVDDAREEFLRENGCVVVDRFDNRLPADLAWKAHLDFEQRRDSLVESMMSKAGIHV